MYEVLGVLPISQIFNIVVFDHVRCVEWWIWMHLTTLEVRVGVCYKVIKPIARMVRHGGRVEKRMGMLLRNGSIWIIVLLYTIFSLIFFMINTWHLIFNLINLIGIFAFISSIHEVNSRIIIDLSPPHFADWNNSRKYKNGDSLSSSNNLLLSKTKCFTLVFIWTNYLLLLTRESIVTLHLFEQIYQILKEHYGHAHLGCLMFHF